MYGGKKLKMEKLAAIARENEVKEKSQKQQQRYAWNYTSMRQKSEVDPFMRSIKGLKINKKSTVTKVKKIPMDSAE